MALGVVDQARNTFGVRIEKRTYDLNLVRYFEGVSSVDRKANIIWESIGVNPITRDLWIKGPALWKGTTRLGVLSIPLYIVDKKILI